MSLEWWADLHYWELSEEETLVYYRIERQSHARDAPTGDRWQVVDTVHTTNIWSGPVETGHWHYRVRLIGLVSGDLIHECQETKWAEAVINVLTPQEELAQVCEVEYVYHIGATVEPAPDGQSETVTLIWYLDKYSYDHLALPEGTSMTYRIERVRHNQDGSAGNWQMVVEVSDTDTWSGAADPGKWIYRVALVSLQVGDLAAQCEKPRWEKTEVWVPTPEERAREASDRRILIEQATICAKDALTANFAPAAQEVVGRHIEKRVAEVAAEYSSDEVATYGLITLAVLFCTDGEIFSGYGVSLSAQSYILSVLFDGDLGW